MKKSLLFVLALCFSLIIAGSVFAYEGYFCHPNDFVAKSWKENFHGKGFGRIGNELKVEGEGFVFQDAKLSQYSPGRGEAGYRDLTFYDGGKLILNNRGPWGQRYTATNVSCWNNSTFNQKTHYPLSEL